MSSKQQSERQSGQQSERGWFARHKVLTGIGAVAAVLTIGGVAAGGSGGGAGASPSASAGGAHTAAASAKAKGHQQKKAATIDGSGTYEVGSDIKPGTYRSTGNADGMCYWERAKDATGSSDSILANDNVTGTTYVTIKASDKYFKTTDCGDWTAASGAASGSPAAQLPGNAMAKVGTDIAPGTYKSTGNKDDECYWERDKDATGDSDSVIANDNVSGTAIVTLKASDAYFKTSGCGAWKKTG